MDGKDIKNILEIVSMAAELKPAWDEAGKAASLFLPDIKNMFCKLNDHLAAENARLFLYYLENGFTREEAMLLVIDSKVALKKIVGDYNKRRTENG